MTSGALDARSIRTTAVVAKLVNPQLSRDHSHGEKVKGGDE